MSEMPTNTLKPTKVNPARKPYVQPQLEVLGRFKDLTHNSIGTFSDGLSKDVSGGVC